MATTVNQAFSDFLRDSVRLDAEETKKARASRDWLRGQLGLFADRDATFPTAYPDGSKHIDFGSFARRTKIRPLDDIDTIWCLHAEGNTYIDLGERVEIHVLNVASNQHRYCHDDGLRLNSRKIINRFVAMLSDVPQYSNAGIKRDGEAARLDLVSYPWSFDVVPAFFTSPESDGRDYYLVPDGNGHWKKTDPRRDRDRCSRVNQANDGHVLDVIRMAKYWNRRPTMPSMPSYMLETMLLDLYESGSVSASKWVDIELVKVFAHVAEAVMRPVWDGKSIQGDLNTLSWNERVKIAQRASSDLAFARDARRHENADEQGAAIGLWGKVLGGAFPTFDARRALWTQR